MPGVFNVEAPAQVSGQQYVAPVEGGDTKILAGAVEAFGGIGKQVYEGAVLGELTGSAQRELEAKQMETDKLDEELGFTKISLATQQGVLSKAEARQSAIAKKNEAIASAPWMRNEIEDRFNKWFGIGGKGSTGYGSSYGGGIFEEDKMRSVALDIGLNLHKEGKIYLKPDATNEEVIAASDNYMRNLQLQQEIENRSLQNTTQAVDMLNQNSVKLFNSWFDENLNIVNSNRTPEEKKAELARLRGTRESSIRMMVGYDKLDNDQKSRVDKIIESTVKVPFDELSADSYLNGSLSANSVKNKLASLIDKTAYMGIGQDPAGLALTVFSKYYGENLATFLLGGQIAASASDIYSTMLQAGRDAVNDRTPADTSLLNRTTDMAITKATESATKGEVKSYNDFVKLFMSAPKDVIDSKLASMSSKEIAQQLRFSEQFIKDDARPTVAKFLEDNSLDPNVLSNVMVTESNGNVVLSRTKDSTASSEDINTVIRGLRGIVGTFAFNYQLNKASGSSSDNALSSINELLGLGEFAAPKPRPIAEAVGQTAAGLTQETGALLNMDVMDYYNTYLQPLGVDIKQSVLDSYNSVQEFINDFGRGFTSNQGK